MAVNLTNNGDIYFILFFARLGTILEPPLFTVYVLSKSENIHEYPLNSSFTIKVMYEGSKSHYRQVSVMDTVQELLQDIFFCFFVLYDGIESDNLTVSNSEIITFDFHCL